MAEFNRYERVASPDDPRRCQANSQHGQCRIVQVPGSTYCFIHGGKGALIAASNERKRVYLLTQYRARVDALLENDAHVSLREEIALLRMLIEARFRVVKTDGDLLMHSGAIADLVSRVDKVVTSCNRLERNLGELIDKSTLVNIADNIVAAIASILADIPDVDERIALIGDAILRIIAEGSANVRPVDNDAPVSGAPSARAPRERERERAAPVLIPDALLEDGDDYEE
jgi:hypothetical protein